MLPSSIPVPAALLADSALPASAKLVWIAARLDGRTDEALLQSRTGLSKPTVRKALRLLSTAGWPMGPGPVGPGPVGPGPVGPGPVGPGPAALPAALLCDHRIGTFSRLLYGLLQFTPGFVFPNGRFTIAQLSGLTGGSPNTLKASLTELTQAGWLRTAQKNKLHPIRFTLCNPVAARGEAALLLVAQRLLEADHRGEEIMREYLNLLVDSREYRDNDRIGPLVNPQTGGRLELDRHYYKHGVAFEFHGPQHDGQQTDFATMNEATMQRTRDLIKLGLCTEQKIKVVVLRAEDLKLETIQANIGDLLPRRDLTGYEPLIAHLEEVSEVHRRSARKPWRRRTRKPGPR